MPNFLIDHLAETLLDIGQQKATCLVRIATEHGQRMGFFEDGDLVWFASDDAREPLAAFLTADGRLDDPASREKIAALDAPQRPIVAQIVESGIADAERLRPWLLEYTYQCVAHAFDDRQGSVKVMPKLRAQHPLSLRIPGDLLALEAVRRMRDAALVRETIGPLTWLAEPAADHMNRLMLLPLNYQEGIVGSQLMVRMALKELIAVSDLPEDDALRAILALRLTGIVPPFEEPKELTDTGRLRMRQAALEQGVAVDAAAVLALGKALGMDDEHSESAGAISMGEFEQGAWGQSPNPAPAEPAVAQGNLRRAESGQLRVLASVYVQMAAAEAAAGNFNGAVQNYETALNEKPGELTVILPFAKYLMTFDKPAVRDATERLLKKGCAANPNATAPRVMLAQLYRLTGRPAQALEVLADAERIDPDDPDVQAELGGKARGGFFSKLRGGG